MSNKRTGNFYLIIVCLFFVFTSSCNITKTVPKGDALYTGATVKVDDSTLSKKEKNKIVDLTEHLPRPKPNGKFLGIPFKLLIYNLGGKDTSKHGFLRKFFRKLGEPPVLLSGVNLEYNTKVLRNFLDNKGYFHAYASGDTTVKRKKAHATYTLEPGVQYTIKEVSFVTDSSAVGQAIQASTKETLLKAGDPFDLDLIKSERTRIDAVLKEEGYYFFGPELLILDIDSTIGNNQINVYVQTKKTTPSLAKKPYIIDDVYIYPNYRLNASKADTSHENNILYNGYYIIDPQEKFKPKLVPRILRFDSGDVYNRTDHNLTLSRLINLNIFKFVKNRFELSPNSQGDTGRLNTYYYLTPLPKKALRAELSGNTKSNNYVGSLITLSFTNRNTFRDAEQMIIHANVGSEVQYSGSQSGFNTYSLGGGITFAIPKFVVPFFKFNTTNEFVPKTKITLSYDLLNRRKLYTLNSFKGELGYSWKPNIKIQHELNPISVNYVQALNVTPLYLDSIKSNFNLKHAVDTQFVIGSNYSYTFDPLANQPQGTGFYFNGITDLSGNVAGLLTKASGPDQKKRIAGAPISQYVKLQSDLRYYYSFSNTLRLANRVIFGFGYPYGNSRQLPFIKQFFIGGNNSIRAFRSRSVGPGIFREPNADSLSFFPDESGDIKLELNSELRIKVNNVIEGAFFVDAGNIWLYNKDTATLPGTTLLARPGAEFTKDFFNQLAVGAGIGLRLNLQILLLRVDIATPLRKPYLPPGQRWVINQIDFSNREWRRQNIVLNLAIGYPF
ncbi:MAG: BamA/TamA family outer membrane protein [Ginsengibacter sp.]